MNILFIIGNSFDINLGLKTKYTDFYNYYKKIKSNINSIQNLKNIISSDYKSWSDLEIALGNYTEHLKSLEEFDEVFDDIGEQLAEYLIQEEAKLDINKIDKNSFFEYLSSPENSLSQGYKEEIISFREKWNNHYYYINLVTFNYTRTIEKIIGEEIKNIEIGLHHKIAPIQLLELEHIHGYVDDRMVIGVNDIKQIKNKDFHQIDDILDSIVKTNCNKAHNHRIDYKFEQQIETANLICIYGSSIGDTDNCWWQFIGKRLKDNCRLIIFSKGEEVKPRESHKNNRIATKIKNLFLEKTLLSDEEKKQIIDKIYVGINTKMFGNILK